MIFTYYPNNAILLLLNSFVNNIVNIILYFAMWTVTFPRSSVFRNKDKIYHSKYAVVSLNLNYMRGKVCSVTRLKYTTQSMNKPLASKCIKLCLFSRKKCTTQSTQYLCQKYVATAIRHVNPGLTGRLRLCAPVESASCTRNYRRAN